MPIIPRPARPPLQRNPRRRLIGGVCAGIADYLGINVTLVRIFFVLAMLFGSLGFWIYLALWFLLPAGSEIPMPKVSWALARELRRIDGRISKLHRKHDPRVADLAQEAFDALKTLAPQFESGAATGPDAALRTAALDTFPKVLDRILSFPARSFADASDEASPATVLLHQLADIRAQLQQAAKGLVEKEFAAVFRSRKEDSPELAAWRERLHPLQQQLKQRSGPTTLVALENIEEKLAFLLDRTGQGGEPFDLRPFEVRRIAFDYLPDALDQYLQLPASMARTQPLGSGKTAEESLNEQLNLLDNTLHELARSLFEKDAGGLLVHGRFLKEKFAEQPFRLDDIRAP